MSWLFAQTVEEPSSRILSDMSHGALLTVVFGLLGIVLLLLGYWLFDRITPRVDFQKELREKNVAVAIVIAALLLGLAYIIGVGVK
jgi:putative membrane protein